MLFSYLAHGLKVGVVKCSLNVQESSQSNKPILEHPVNLTNKTGEPSLQTYQYSLHVDGSAVDMPPSLHLSYLSTNLSSVQKEGSEVDRTKGFQQHSFFTVA
jgi:hypothetical protein